jgi:hypothetical protein
MDDLSFGFTQTISSALLRADESFPDKTRDWISVWTAVQLESNIGNTNDEDPNSESTKSAPIWMLIWNDRHCPKITTTMASRILSIDKIMCRQSLARRHVLHTLDFVVHCIHLATFPHSRGSVYGFGVFTSKTIQSTATILYR